MPSQKKSGVEKVEKKDNIQGNSKRRKRRKTGGRRKRQEAERKRLIKLILLGILIGVLMFILDRELYIEDSIARKINIGTDKFEVYLADTVGKMLVVYSGDKEYGVLTIQKEGKKYRNSYVIYSDEKQIIPFCYGDGNYVIGFFEHVAGSEFKLLSKKSLKIEIKDEFSPFIGLGYYVSFSDNITDLADRLWTGNVKEYIENVFNYVLKEIQYDKEFQKAVSNGEITVYKPDVDEIIETRKGVCIDKVSLMASLLRMKGIPTKIVTGYINNNEYHAWLEVYTNGKWELFDPTLNVNYGDTDMQNYMILNYY